MTRNQILGGPFYFQSVYNVHAIARVLVYLLISLGHEARKDSNLLDTEWVLIVS